MNWSTKHTHIHTNERQLKCKSQLQWTELNNTSTEKNLPYTHTHIYIYIYTHTVTQSETTNKLYGISNIEDLLRKKYIHKNNTEHTLGKGKKKKKREREKKYLQKIYHRKPHQDSHHNINQKLAKIIILWKYQEGRNTGKERTK